MPGNTSNILTNLCLMFGVQAQGLYWIWGGGLFFGSTHLSFMNSRGRWRSHGDINWGDICGDRTKRRGFKRGASVLKVIFKLIPTWSNIPDWFWFVCGDFYMSSKLDEGQKVHDAVEFFSCWNPYNLELNFNTFDLESHLTLNDLHATLNEIQTRLFIHQAKGIVRFCGRDGCQGDINHVYVLKEIWNHNGGSGKLLRI